MIKRLLMSTALATAYLPAAHALELPEYGINIDASQALAGITPADTLPTIEPVPLGEVDLGARQQRLEEFYKPVTKGQENVNITAFDDDLDGDGVRELIVMISSAKTCTIAGCQVDILEDKVTTFRVLHTNNANQVLIARGTPLGKQANLIMDQTRTEDENGKTRYLSQVTYVRAADGSYTETQ